MRHQPLSIAFIIRDPLPPLRADVLTLFGEQMPRYGIATDLVGQSGSGAAAPWAGGAMHTVGRLGALASVATPLWDALGLARAWRRAPLDAIQVRDKVASGLVGRLAAAMLGLPFVYWMSFPIVEGYAVRRDQIVARGPRWLAHALRAALSRAVLYRLVLPGARHVFVQSEAMADWLARQGIARSRMTAVPMGVDVAQFSRAALTPSTDPRLDGRRVIVYLGRIGRARQSDFLLDVVVLLRARTPAILLVIAGDAASADEMGWMRACIAARGLETQVLLTGWLSQQAALGYALRAEVGLSPIPRGALFDVASPTKLVEYLALGLPSVANDIPDQRLVIEQSGAGLVAPMQAQLFSAAVQVLLDDPALRTRCAERGPHWVRTHRSYEVLGRKVADTYSELFPDEKKREN
jgi:glycosyltransferase involved in cell wall biosynthesis